MLFRLANYLIIISVSITSAFRDFLANFRGLIACIFFPLSSKCILTKYVCTPFLALFIFINFLPIPAFAGVAHNCETTFDNVSGGEHIICTLKSDGVGKYASEYPTNYVFLVDSSKSMRETVEGKTKLQWIDESIKSFVDYQHSYQSKIGLLTFSDRVTKVCDLTSDFEQIENSLNTSTEEGFDSDIEKGLEASISLLEENKDDSQSVIILIIEGINSENADPQRISYLMKKAVKSGIIINVVNMENKGGPESIYLKSLATETGGSYWESSYNTLARKLLNILNSGELLTACRLNIEISQSEDSVIDSSSIKFYESSGLASTKLDEYRYFVPSFGIDDEVKIEMDAFMKKRDGNVTPAVVDISYIDSKGKNQNEKIVIADSINIGQPSFFERNKNKILIVISFIVLVFVILFKIYRDAK